MNKIQEDDSPNEREKADREARLQFTLSPGGRSLGWRVVIYVHQCCTVLFADPDRCVSMPSLLNLASFRN